MELVREKGRVKAELDKGPLKHTCNCTGVTGVVDFGVRGLEVDNGY